MNYAYSSKYPNQLKIKQIDQPLDTVSCIIWNPYLNDLFFMTGGWDSIVRLYQINASNNQIQKKWDIFLHHPVLSIDVNQNNLLFAGLASGNILAVDMTNSNIACLGTHDAPVVGTFWLKQKGVLMTLGMDKFIKFWTIDQPNKPQAEISLPLKTISCSYDYPYLLIGSFQSTVAIVSLKNLPNINYPQNQNQYQRISFQKFSRINCCKINASSKKGIVGAIDGRTSNFAFKQDYNGSITVSDAFVTRSQKKNQGKNLFGQVDCVDLGSYNYEVFGLIGGSQDLSSYNFIKKTKHKTVASTNSSIGAITAVKLSPKLDYIIYASGTDWLKGLGELENMKKAKIGAVKNVSSDLSSLTSKV